MYIYIPRISPITMGLTPCHCPAKKTCHRLHDLLKLVRDVQFMCIKPGPRGTSASPEYP